MIDVVVLGGGHMGALHARVFAQAAPEHARVTGVYDIEPAVATRLAVARGVRAFETLALALEGAGLVVVATPSDTHRALAQAALSAGRAVLVEKPVCTNVTDALALRAAQRRAGRPVLVGHSERFNPVVLALRERVRGRGIRRVTCRRMGTARAREHVLLNLAVHDLDLGRVLLGEALTLRAARGDGDAVHALLVGGTGELVLHADQCASERCRTIDVELDDGEVLRGDLLRSTLAVDGRVTAIPSREPLLLQAQAVLSELGAPVEAAARAADLHDGLAAVTLAGDGVDLVDLSSRWAPKVDKVDGVPIAKG
jgi:predicted dehydrogenase